MILNDLMLMDMNNKVIKDELIASNCCSCFI